MKKIPIYLSFLVYIFLVVSLALHTSSNAEIFGRYSIPLFLLLLFYVGFFFFYVRIVRFLFGNSSHHSEIQKLFSKAIFQFLIYAIPLFLCFIPLEIYMRLNFHHLFPKKDIRAFHPFLQTAPLKNNPVLHVNSHGFRGNEISIRKPPGTFRIFVMGGSTVFCRQMPFEKTHCRILEGLLNGRFPGRHIEVLNAGYEWYSSEHSVINYLFKVKDFDPDLIIIWHGINDLYRSFSPKKYASGEFQADYSHFLGPISKIVFNYFKPRPILQGDLLLVQYLFDNLFKGKARIRLPVRVKAVDVHEFRSLSSFERNMTSFVRNVQMDGVGLILATQPFLYRPDLGEQELKLAIQHELASEGGTYPNLNSMNIGMNRFNEKTKSIAEKYDTPLLDLEAKIPKTTEYFLDDVHYTEKGNVLIAETIFQFIVKNDFIKS